MQTQANLGQNSLQLKCSNYTGIRVITHKLERATRLMIPHLFKEGEPVITFLWAEPLISFLWAEPMIHIRRLRLNIAT